MKERSLGIILGILNIVLLAVCGIFFLGKDKNAPEIFLPEGSIVYAKEAGTEPLFEGVTAFDEEDGELTGSVIIEKIVTDESKETATVTYGVADSSGNVEKVTCTVEMIVEDVSDIPEEINTQEAEPERENGSADETGEESDSESAEESAEGEKYDRKSGEENTEAEEESDSESNEENVGNDSESGEESEEESDEVNEEEDSQEEGTTEEDNREALPTAGEASNAGQSAVSGRPSIVFTKQEIKARAGNGPAWVEVIGALNDDKDSYETLFGTLKINGTYDKDKAGAYEIMVTVTDSDGNESEPCPMKIIVEE